MKNARGLIAFLLTVAMCFTAASAHTHIGVADLEAEVQPTVSPWAQEEVDRAIAAGLFPENLKYSVQDFRLPATRELFISFVMAYTALQSHFDADTLSYMVAETLGGEGTHTKYRPVFTDGTEGREEIAAYHLGLITGRGDGSYDPEGLITRQEAAVMLTRAYEVCGGDISGCERSAASFADTDQIADWAQSSMVALNAWGVMSGTEDRFFLPEGTYTIEQCLITFLRLYEQAPVSRLNGNHKQLYTYEQCMDFLNTRTKPSGKDGTGYTYYVESIRVDGARATFVRLDLNGLPRPGMMLYFVHYDGGITKFKDFGLCDEPYFGQCNSLPMKDCSFSEDGNMFYFTATLPNDIIRDGVLLHAKGDYRVTLDVDTLAYELQHLG